MAEFPLRLRKAIRNGLPRRARVFGKLLKGGQRFSPEMRNGGLKHFEDSWWFRQAVFNGQRASERESAFQEGGSSLFVEAAIAKHPGHLDFAGSAIPEGVCLRALVRRKRWSVAIRSSREQRPGGAGGPADQSRGNQALDGFVGGVRWRIEPGSWRRWDERALCC